MRSRSHIRTALGLQEFQKGAEVIIVRVDQAHERGLDRDLVLEFFEAFSVQRRKAVLRRNALPAANDSVQRNRPRWPLSPSTSLYAILRIHL